MLNNILIQTHNLKSVISIEQSYQIVHECSKSKKKCLSERGNENREVRMLYDWSEC